MTKKSETRAPALLAFHVREGKGDNAKAFWTRIGAAWPHQNGNGFTVQLDCYPVDGRIVLRPAKADELEGGAA